MNTLFILVSLTFSNGAMTEKQVIDQTFKTEEACMLAYKQILKTQHKKTIAYCTVKK